LWRIALPWLAGSLAAAILAVHRVAVAVAVSGWLAAAILAVPSVAVAVRVRGCWETVPDGRAVGTDSAGSSGRLVQGPGRGRSRRAAAVLEGGAQLASGPAPGGRVIRLVAGCGRADGVVGEVLNRPWQHVGVSPGDAAQPGCRRDQHRGEPGSDPAGQPGEPAPGRAAIGSRGTGTLASHRGSAPAR
jgi:hypothetical protein